MRNSLGDGGQYGTSLLLILCGFWVARVRKHLKVMYSPSS